MLPIRNAGTHTEVERFRAQLSSSVRQIQQEEEDIAQEVRRLVDSQNPSIREVIGSDFERVLRSAFTGGAIGTGAGSAYLAFLENFSHDDLLNSPSLIGSVILPLAVTGAYVSVGQTIGDLLSRRQRARWDEQLEDRESIQRRRDLLSARIELMQVLERNIQSFESECLQFPEWESIPTTRVNLQDIEEKECAITLKKVSVPADSDQETIKEPVLYIEHVDGHEHTYVFEYESLVEWLTRQGSPDKWFNPATRQLFDLKQMKRPLFES